MEEKPQPSAHAMQSVVGVLAAFVLGIFGSGFTGLLGMSSTGHHYGTTNPFPIVSPIVAIFFVWICGFFIALAVLVVSLIVSRKEKTIVLALIFGTPTLMLIGGMILPPVQARRNAELNAIWTKRNNDADAARKKEYARLYEQLRSDPEIVLSGRWYAAEGLLHWVVRDSLMDPSVPYTLDLLKRLYAEAPAIRAELFCSPACDPAFLREHFQEALDLASSKNLDMLACILKNPNTPRELLEKVANDPEQKFRGGTFAQEALNERDRQENAQK